MNMPTNDKWYKKNVTRIIFNIVLTVFSTIAAAFLTSLKGAWFCFDIVVVVVLSCSSVLFSFYYATLDVKKDIVFQKARMDMLAYSQLFSSLIDTFKRASKGINNIARNIAKDGIIAEERWTFNESSIDICTKVYKFIKNIALQGSDIHVWYIKVSDIDDDKIQLVGYGNKDSETPGKYMLERSITDPKAYYDCKLFTKKSAEPVFRLTSQEVDDILTFKDREREKGQYSQCLLIPAFCADKKMVGLLEIFAKKGTIIANTDEEMTNLKSKLRPFCELLVLLQKVEKAALAIPPSK